MKIQTLQLIPLLRPRLKQPPMFQSTQLKTQKRIPPRGLQTEQQLKKLTRQLKQLRLCQPTQRSTRLQMQQLTRLQRHQQNNQLEEKL